MQLSIKNEVNNTVANLGASVELLPTSAKKLTTKLATALAKADKLRGTADASYTKYVVAGRDALTAIMGDVYALYCDIKQDESTCKAAIAQMTEVVTLDSAVRSTSSDASVLVRYICRNLSDKNVSIYSRCIALAHKNKVDSGGLAALVKATQNGWLGLLSKYATTKKGAGVSTTSEEAASYIRALPTVQTISAADWGNDETVRVFIATYNDIDGTADIKNASLSTESIAIVLKRYAADKKTREKPTKTGEVDVLKLVITALEGRIANAETDVGNIAADINVAVAQGDNTRAGNLRVNLRVAEAELKSSKAALKSEKNELEKLMAE